MIATIKSASKADLALKVDGLNYSYKGLCVFKDFSLASDSEIVVLRGASGCGKTTLLKILSGNLMPDFVVSMPSTKGSCLVLQEDSLFPWLSGLENISKITGIKEAQFRKHPMFEVISSYVDRKACRMSYGQRRMVELFRALVFKPKSLYLDEPFNFLDEGNMSLVVPYLQKAASEGTRLVLSNHHQDDKGLISKADIFKFDGNFPVVSLSKIG